MLPALIASVTGLECPIDHAEYVLRTQPEITATFQPVESGRDWPSGLAMTLKKAGKPLGWFLPWQGGTDRQMNLASTKDVSVPGWTPPSPDDGPRPLGDYPLIVVDADYRVLDRIPMRGGTAPAHFLIPRLDDGLWHAEQVDVAQQFFDLIKCDARE